MRRTTLHAALAGRAKEVDTEWVSTKVTALRQDSAGVCVAGIRARYLLGADGLHSTVRRLVGIPATVGSPRRVGLRRHYRVPAWSEFVEVYWSPMGEAYVTPVEPDLVGVAILSRHRHDLSWFPTLQGRLTGAACGDQRGGGPLRQVVSRRVAGRVMLVGDAAGYEDALTGEGVSLAVKQARAAVAAVLADAPRQYERDWHSITRRYRWLTRALVLGTATAAGHRAIVPASAALPFVFREAVNALGQ